MGIYKTEPLKCWGKAKELRLSVYEGIQKARDEIDSSAFGLL